MTELIDKEAVLENAGYRYHFDRMIYFKLWCPESIQPRVR